MCKINYRKGNPGMREAWFKFKKDEPQDAKSVPSFAAGWNAALAHINNTLLKIIEEKNAKSND